MISPYFPPKKIRGIFLEKEGEGDNMRRISLLWKVVRITHAERFAVGYVLLLFLVAVAVWLAEPSITILADSLWYCFAASTTIGFGDFVAVTWGGRILTVLLALYGIFVVALVPGVMVNYFIEFNKIRYNESLVLFMDQLETSGYPVQRRTPGNFRQSPQFPQKIKKQSISFEKCSVFICGQVLFS